jgi:isoleucyl-tRNA synthetase
MTLRSEVLAHIEPLRKAKEIGSSLQARVVLPADGPDAEFQKAHADLLPTLFIVSEVEFRGDLGQPIKIERASGVKCERCWRYVKSVSSEPAWAGLCDRCQDALAEPIHG